MSQVQDDFDHTDMVVISDDCSSTESESSDNNDDTSSCRTPNKSSAANPESTNTITPSTMTAANTANNHHPVSFAAARNVVNPNAIDSWIRNLGSVAVSHGSTGGVSRDNAASISLTKNDVHTTNALDHTQMSPPGRRDGQTGVITKEDHSTTFTRAETLNKYATSIHQHPGFQDAKDHTIHQHGKTPTWSADTREDCATPPQQPSQSQPQQPQPAEMPDDEDPQSRTASTQDVADTPDVSTGTKRSLPPIVQRYERSPMQKVSKPHNGGGVRRGETHVTAKDWVHWIRRDLDMPEFEVVWSWLNEMPSDTPSKRVEKSLARSLRRLARHYPTEHKEKYMRWHTSFMHDLGLSSR
jgi:hypothetical protein